MQVVLLGTGGADGWPNPFCSCASCTAARADGPLRGQSSALVDDVLLLDCGPEVPRAAVRLGRTLAGVRHLLLTHAHSDHTAPPVLLWRRWAARVEPLDLVGPPAAVDECLDWIGPGDPVRLHRVGAGDRLRLSGYDVRVLAAEHGGPELGPAVLYDVTAPDGSRLLWATDTGPLPDPTVRAAAGAAYDLVLLEESLGDPDHGTGAHGTDHLDLATFPRQLARLREAGALGEHTDVVAVHLTHRNPPTPELARRLSAWGARTVPDGTVLDLPPAQDRVSPPGTTRPASPAVRGHSIMDGRVLVLGGARSGKSTEAERRLAAAPDVTYVATSRIAAGDDEWAARIAVHQARRPPEWTTVETTDVAAVLRSTPGPVLVDCLSLWLAAELDDAEAWEADSPTDALARVHERVEELVAAWRAHPGALVAVSNEVGSGIVPATTSGRLYRDELGRLNARLAAESDEVVLMVAGRALPLTPR